MVTRAEKMAATRIKLLAAARKAFAEEGYAKASMDKLTAEVGLTRGALYHNFGDKRGLFAAVVDQLDSEMAERAKAYGAGEKDVWGSLLKEGTAYIRSALDPEIQQIVLRDGPAVLGDPSRWPSQNRCLEATKTAIEHLIDSKVFKPVDPTITAMLINGAAMNAAMWIAANGQSSEDADKTISIFITMVSGFLEKPL